jgi:uncharacterized protein YlzI (FlbEa/FlbD family)
MAPAAAALLVMVVLHRVDGGEVAVNPAQVTSLRNVPGRLQGQLTETARCLVGLTDGKQVAVREACTEVRRRLEAGR